MGRFLSRRGVVDVSDDAVVVVFGLASFREALAGGGAGHHHHSVLAPHADQEIAARAGAAYIWRKLYFSAGMEAELPVSGELDRSFASRTEVGVVPARAWRIAVGFDVPLAGLDRFTWRARLGLARQL